MKKFFIYCMVFLLVIIFTGCSSNFIGNSSPEEVAINYLKGLTEVKLELMDKYSIVEYKELLMPMIEKGMEEEGLTESQVYEMAFRGEDIEDIPTNFKEYIEVYSKIVREDLADELGENYSIDVKVITTTDLNNEEKNKLFDDARRIMDNSGIDIDDIIELSKIEEVKEMECEISLKGEKDVTEDADMYVVKYDGRWKVFNLIQI